MKSTNAHGVHSPFVYELLTKSLYGTPKTSKNPGEDMALKCIAHFHYTNIRIVGNTALAHRLQSGNSNLDFEMTPIDLIYFEDPSALDLDTVFTEYTLHNDSVIVLPYLRNTADSFAIWEKCVAHSKITVSLDCYHVGVAFLRKEQVKQHFFIRY